jgi:uncharacterized protein
LGRVLLLLIIGLAVYLAFKGFFRVNARKPDMPAKTVSGEDMVACARCGVNLPRSDARLQEGTFYCQDNPRCRAP